MTSKEIVDGHLVAIGVTQNVQHGCPGWSQTGSQLPTHGSGTG